MAITQIPASEIGRGWEIEVFGHLGTVTYVEKTDRAVAFVLIFNDVFTSENRYYMEVPPDTMVYVNMK